MHLIDCADNSAGVAPEVDDGDCRWRDGDVEEKVID